MNIKRIEILLIILMLLSISFSLNANQKQHITVGVDENYPPYEFVDARGNITGFNVDLLKRIGEKNNIEFIFESGNWSDIKDKFNTGKLDMLSGMYYSVEREKLYSFSIPHSYVYFSIFHRNDTPYKNKNSLIGKKILVQKDDFIHEYLKGLGNKVTIIPVQSPEEAIVLLSNDKNYDYAILSKVISSYIIKQKNIQNISFNPDNFASKKYCYTFHKDDLKLLSKVNEGIFIVTNSGEYTELYNKWFKNIEPAKIDYRVFWAFLIPSLFLIFMFLFYSLRLNKKFKYKSRLLVDSKSKEQEFKNAFEKNVNMLKNLMEIMNEGVWEWNLTNNEIFFNYNIYTLLEYEPFDFPQSLNSILSIVHQDDRDFLKHFMIKFLKSSKESFECEIRILTKNGDTRWFSLKGIASDKTNEGIKQKIIGTYSDITEKKRLNEHQQQSQKMEALGRLAGGISHDFNNLLTSIMGNLDIALVSIEKDTMLYNRLKSIRETAIKASELTKQLLFMSRKKENNPEPIDLNSSIKKMNTLLLRIIGEDINLTLQLEEGLPMIKADSMQIDQLLLNLAINSRESMPEGGRVIIETQKVYLDENDMLLANEFNKGTYIQLNFSDNGSGMDSETLQHLFEPFYSIRNKESGLGLSIVYNIMLECKGFINVYSELNHGTTFKLYFPIFNLNDNINFEHNENQFIKSQGNEKILLVEDNPEIRMLIKDIAHIGNYLIEVFSNSTEFFDYMDKNKETKFDILICDIVLPDIKGYELVNRFKDTYPHAFNILYISGYPNEVIIREHPISSANFLSKPFSASALLNKIRYIIDHRISS